MYYRKKLLNYVSVWSRNANGSQSSNDCIVMAHGGEASINGMRSTPICTLAFYVRHGTNLPDPGILEIMSERAKPCQQVRSRDSQDYELSKRLTQKEDNVTLGLGGVELEKLADLEDQLVSEIMKLEQEVYDPDFTNVAKELKLKKLHFLKDVKWKDLVVVQSDKNRSSRAKKVKHLKLSVVLKTLRKEGYDYSIVHCAHCRGGEGKPAGQVAFNQPAPSNN